MRSYISKSTLGRLLFFLPLYMAGGYFARHYQLQRELLQDGSLIPGAFMHKILLILAATFVVAFAGIFLFTKPRKTFRSCFSCSVLSGVAQILGAVGLIAGNFLQLGNTEYYAVSYTQVSLALTNSLPYWGIFAGICVLLFATATMKGRKPSALPYMLVSLYLAVKLIVRFQAWNTDPSIHDYAYSLLFSICTMLGCFQVSAFSFDKGGRRITGFWCVCSVFFGALSAPDHVGNTGTLLVQLSLILLTLVMTLEMVAAKEEGNEDPVEEVTEEAPEPQE